MMSRKQRKEKKTMMLYVYMCSQNSIIREQNFHSFDWEDNFAYRYETGNKRV